MEKTEYPEGIALEALRKARAARKNNIELKNSAERDLEKTIASWREARSKYSKEP